VGGADPIATDVRLIAATNRDLDTLVTDGRFRQDLLYRLNGVTIHLPPLRDRKDDLPPLVDHFLRRMSAKLGKAVTAIAPDAMRVLEHHTWPGNIRELQNVIRYGVIQAVADVLTADCLPGAITGRGTAPPVGGERLADVRELVRALIHAGSGDLYRRVIQAVDRVVVDAALEHVQGNQVNASELLGISRTTLRAKLAARDTEPN
jgi:DNA-binding NtrC family response regulator